LVTATFAARVLNTRCEAWERLHKCDPEAILGGIRENRFPLGLAIARFGG
jgi:hypothetical protein